MSKTFVDEKFVKEIFKLMVLVPYIFFNALFLEGVRGSAVGLGTALQAERSRVRYPMWSFGFFIILILPAALWP